MSGGLVSDFTMLTTQIVPTVGSGSDWNWALELSADLASGGTFTDILNLPSGTSSLGSAVSFIAPAGDSFGLNPTFFVTVTKNNETNTRSIGWMNFEITVVPEPGSLALLGAGMGWLLLRRRRSN